MKIGIRDNFKECWDKMSVEISFYSFINVFNGLCILINVLSNFLFICYCFNDDFFIWYIF